MFKNQPSSPQRTAELLKLWADGENFQQTMPPELDTFLEHEKTTDMVEGGVIGLLLWKKMGQPQPTPQTVLVRVFPLLFQDEYPDLQAKAKALFASQSATAFFNLVSNRNLADEESTPEEAWYAIRILSSYTLENCSYYDQELAK